LFSQGLGGLGREQFTDADGVQQIELFGLKADAFAFFALTHPMAR
jgi:hypothetical protein